MKKRGLIISVLVMLAVITSGFTYAFWAASVIGDNKEVAGSVQIGAGDDVTTTVVVSGVDNEGLLVPQGFQDGVDTFYYIDLTFNVVWNADEDGAAGTSGTLLAVIDTDSFVIVEDLDEKESTGLTAGQIDVMFDIEVISGHNVSINIEGSQAVVVRVTFANEPTTKAIYDMVASGYLMFDITFTVGSIVYPA